MSIEQMVGLAVAAALIAWAGWQAVRARPAAAASLDRCASDTLALASRLRAAGCPEGVAACQRLLNVILEHPDHQAPEVLS